MAQMAPEERRRLLVRKKLLEDFEAYCGACVKIRPKSAEDGSENNESIPFKFNRAQRLFWAKVIDQLNRTGKVRVIVLKARQLGLSTFWGAFQYWWVSQRKGQKAIVVTHVQTATAELFEMTKRIHDGMPAGFQPQTARNAGTILQFGKLDSGYRIASAEQKSIGRGSTFNCAHLSEVAFWPPGKAVSNFTAVMAAVPKGVRSKNTFVCIESTANGVGNLFHSLWEAAEAGKSEFMPIFIPWFVDPEYSMPLSEAPESFTLSAADEALQAAHGLSMEQMAWRFVQIAGMEGGHDQFRQEYPSTAEEAFLTSGLPVFHAENLVIRKKELEENPPEQERYTLTAGPRPTWTPWHRGDLTVYQTPQKGEQYYIGSDVSSGTSKDWTTAQVFDSSMRQVAVWRGKIIPSLWAGVLAAIGRWYNDAKIIIEVNNHGLLPATRLEEDEGYHNVFTREVYDELNREHVSKVGFYTDEKTRPLVIGELQERIQHSTLVLNNLETIQELLTFINTKAGKQEAEKGCNDDLVMALALVNHIHEPPYVPYVMHDEDYFDMI